ncbi:BCCT family transporter [Paucibacter sp. B2R-40]|uniref:BCCT family transporter n=1 Tax=Paucibacter sp. B2R-40 TaxID=2893554 RepID=UPI0021E3631B|nr:BCCT family transporter [Paucibacter sp. B2R-40]MCV2355974.1 BCCT family transporter [Paucibacter sp. B2R-40]
MQRWISIFIIGLVVAWGLLAQAEMGAFFNGALKQLTRNFGWLYLWVVLGLVLCCLTLAFGRYGQLRLGGDDDKPEFSRAAWFAMLFSAGMGIGLVFYGVAEPVSHFLKPPPGITPESAEAANAAMRYSFFHWGLHPWAVYSVVGLAIGFFQFRRGRPALISSVTDELPWAWAKALGPVINVLAVVATAFGVAASLGVGALQINAGLARLFGLPIGLHVQLIIIAVTTVLFLASALSGLGRGVKWLSSGNLVLAAALALTVFVLGPSVAIIDAFTNNLGGYFSEFVRMSLRMTPFRDSSWVSDWTVFYWAWWISWSPFVGVFIARVSRGRSIKEFILGTMLAPTLAACLWFSVFGGTALHLQIFEGVPIGAAVQADVSTALFSMFDALPLGGLMSLAATVLVVVFFITSGDSATLVLSVMSSGGKDKPHAASKLMWGLLVAAIAASLISVGGVSALQTATIVFALPFTLVLVLLAIALWRGVRADYEAQMENERLLRRKLVKLAKSE